MSIGAQLDLGQGNMRANQWHQFLCHPGTAYTLWPHEAGHCPAPGGTRGPLQQRRSDNLSEDLIPVPNSSQGTVGYDMEVCASPDHH